MNWGIVGPVVSAASLLFAAVTYVLDKQRDRKSRTIKKVSELIEDYHENIADKPINQHYREHVRFLSEVDRFAATTLAGYYSRSQVKKYAGRFLSSVYEKYKDNLIKDRRNQFKNSSYYENLEKLSKK